MGQAFSVEEEEKKHEREVKGEMEENDEDTMMMIPHWCEEYLTKFPYTEKIWGGGYSKGIKEKKVEDNDVLYSSLFTSSTSISRRPDASQKHEYLSSDDGEFKHFMLDTLLESKGIRVLRHFLNGEYRELVVFCETGKNVCGHKTIVHGGFTASLIDNTLGLLACEVCICPATKSLTVNYRKPILAGEFLVVTCAIIEAPEEQTTTTEVKELQKEEEEKGEENGERKRNKGGRKVWVLQAKVIGKSHDVLAEGTGVFVDVSAKWKDILSSKDPNKFAGEEEVTRGRG